MRSRRAALPQCSFAAVERMSIGIEHDEHIAMLKKFDFCTLTPNLLTPNLADADNC